MMCEIPLFFLCVIRIVRGFFCPKTSVIGIGPVYTGTSDSRDDTGGGGDVRHFLCDEFSSGCIDTGSQEPTLMRGSSRNHCSAATPLRRNDEKSLQRTHAAPKITTTECAFCEGVDTFFRGRELYLKYRYPRYTW